MQFKFSLQVLYLWRAEEKNNRQSMNYIVCSKKNHFHEKVLFPSKIRDANE